MKNKIIFLGSKPIGYYCLNHLIQFKDDYDIEIIGVLTNNTNRFGSADLYELCSENSIDVFSNEAKIIDLNWPEEKIWRHIRATSMPGFPPPYTVVNGLKINLIIQ